MVIIRGVNLDICQLKRINQQKEAILDSLKKIIQLLRKLNLSLILRVQVIIQQGLILLRVKSRF